VHALCAAEESEVRECQHLSSTSFDEATCAIVLYERLGWQLLDRRPGEVDNARGIRPFGAFCDSSGLEVDRGS